MPHAFPAPWYVDELGESFVVRDRSGQALAHVDFESDPDNEARRAVMGRLTREEARRIATAIAKLPTLLTGGS